MNLEWSVSANLSDKNKKKEKNYYQTTEKKKIPLRSKFLSVAFGSKLAE